MQKIGSMANGRAKRSHHLCCLTNRDSSKFINSRKLLPPIGLEGQRVMLSEPGIWYHLVGAAIRVDLPTDARSMEDHVPRQLAIQSDEDLSRERGRDTLAPSQLLPGLLLANSTGS